MTHGVQGMRTDSARFCCALRALSAQKSRRFAGEVRPILHAKNLKFSASAATDARTLRQKDVKDRFMHVAQALKIFAELGAVFCSSFGGKNLRLSVKIAKILKKFGAIFARDTRPEPAEALQ